MRHLGLILFPLALAPLALTACGNPGDQPALPDASLSPPPDAGTPDGTPSAACHPSDPLIDDVSVYDQDGRAVLEVSVTVDDLAGLADVEANVDGAEVAALVRADGVGAGATAPNATLKLRGQTSRYTLQKSYKIKLHADAGLWKGQRELNLNKHPYDLTRVRQQLSLELMRGVPGFASLRTRFVHLTINGADRGLFTHVEEPDRRYLAAHGLDPAGTLYKAEDFAFEPIDPEVAADETRLDAILSAKANPDPAKLLRMLDAVNDREQDIDAVVDRHFNRENYATWLALNLLLGNWDTRNQNFLLYSPSGCDVWYFLPWDYDGALLWNEQPGNNPRPRWMAGFANYWAMPPHERFLRVPANVERVRETVRRLRDGLLSDEQVAWILGEIRPVVREYVSAAPDLWNLPLYHGTPVIAERLAQFDAEVDRVAGAVRLLAAELDEVYARPMPVWQGYSEPIGASLLLGWSPSLDLPRAGVTYDYAVATTATFDPGTVIAEASGLTDLSARIDTPPPGGYFWRVVIRSRNQPEVNWQSSFNVSKPFTIR